MARLVRLMVVKQRTGWGYETLVREVSGSLHLRRFCLLPLTQRMSDELTVRKLVRRLGPEVVAEFTRAVIGKARRETRFAARAVRYVVQLAEVTANTRRGARGFLLPAASTPGNPGENRLLEQTTAEPFRLGLRPREVAVDGGFVPGQTEQALAGLAPARTFIAGRAEPGPRRTRRRLAHYRTGCEGRLSHLKRGYGLRRSRLKGD